MKNTETRPRVRCLVWLLSLLTISISATQADERFSPDGFRGSLILIGGGSVPKEVPDFIKATIGDGSIIILAEASSDPKAATESASKWLLEHGISNITEIDHELPKVERLERLIKAVDSANAVWIGGGQQSVLAEAYAGTGMETALQNVLHRGGTIAGTSAGAAIMSKVMIASGQDEPLISTGWDLLPGTILDQHFTERNRLGRTQIAVQKHPDCFGLGIDEGTAVFVTGRRMRIAGKGTASITLAKTAYREEERLQLSPDDIADLTQLRRAARHRAAGVDPGIPQTGAPAVPHGSLVIVGGGGMPPEIVNRFVELAGGKNAQIVVLPTAVPREETSTEAPGFLKRAEVQSITVLPQRADEVSSEEFRSALKSATGIWFGGGRQWNFVDCYEGTEAVELFHDVLRRGGVIGGSSAGATIQGEFLVRGHPLGNTVMMAEGYERGFSFLPGTAIDQHFAQRDRQPDLLPVIRRHPKLLGIGIDEGTAIVVTGSKAEVIGQHAAHFVSAKQMETISLSEELPQTADEASKFYTSVKSGDSIDLGGL